MTFYILEPLHNYTRQVPGYLAGFHSITALRQNIYASVPAAIHAVEVEGGDIMQSSNGWSIFQTQFITHSRKLEEYQL